MHIDPLIPPLVGIVTIILLLGLVLQIARQPQLVGYILTGVLIGPGVLGLVTDQAVIEHLGAIGVTLLLFFIGMEVSPHQMARGWRIAVFGTLFQVLVSVGCTWLLGYWLDWSVARIVLLGFVISLSSTAVVLKLLKDRGELDSKAGENVLLILLAQDLAVIPMLIIVSLLAGSRPDALELGKQVIGGGLIIALAVWAVAREPIRLPFIRHLREDHELQVFAALLLCFGLAFITGMLGLSAALGSFVAGILVASAKETHWVHHALQPMRVVFVALLFVSIGMLIDVRFFAGHWWQIMALVLAVLVTNTFINGGILRLLGDDWRTSLYSGALLSQIGEFSFVLASAGLQAAIITDYGYQLTIAVISLSLVASPVWIHLFRQFKPPVHTAAG